MTEKPLSEPRIVEKEAFTIVGLHYRGKNENKEAHYLWDKFLPREGEIKGRIPKLSYGVSDNFDEKTGEFDYIAGVEVKQVGDTQTNLCGVSLHFANLWQNFSAF
jgi:predicted transcriptional regulator YdeE